MQPPRGLWIVFAIIALAGTIAISAGPPLAEHEAIVGQIARNTLQTGNWLVPYCIGTPFIIKPPLAPWVAAISAMLLPPDAATGLPVSAMAARLPSLLLTALTVLLLYFASRDMFGRRTAWLTAFIYATTVGAWLFAVNATAEAMLTFFAAWAFIEFWWAQQASHPARRRLHLLRFYVALGLAMLAKGPMPLSVVALPIAIYWWCERPLRILAAGGPSKFVAGVNFGLRNAPRRLLDALRRLGLWWGIPIFLLMFLPWMLYVASRDPLAWSIWDVEYVHRLRGDYPGIEKAPGAWYYLPLLFGMMIPWALSLPEALASPFLAAYRSNRRALTFAWFWVVASVVLMSLMKFKKPYYVLPALPGCALLLTPVLARFFDAHRDISLKLARAAVWIMALTMVAGAAVGGWITFHKYPDAWSTTLSRWAIPICVALCIVGYAGAGRLFIARRGHASLMSIGLTTVAVFAIGWCVFAPVLDDSTEATELANQLKAHGIPQDAPIWVANRPDTRFVFYGRLPIKPLVDPYRLVAQDGGTWDDDKHKEKVAGMMYDMLREDDLVCILMDRGQSEKFMRYYEPRAIELFSIDRGKPGETRDDLVVLTNRGAASRPAATAMKRP